MTVFVGFVFDRDMVWIPKVPRDGCAGCFGMGLVKRAFGSGMTGFEELGSRDWFANSTLWDEITALMGSQSVR
jgi:hypothetical protein